MGKAFIVCGKRSPIGSFLGSLKDTSSVDLGVEVAKVVLEKANVNPSDLNEVIVGQILAAGLGQGPARQIAIKAGVPDSVPAYSLNMLCGSGMKAVLNAYDAIVSNRENLILAGGIESMSKSAFVFPATLRSGNKMGDVKLTDSMLTDGLIDAFSNNHMGITAENIATKYQITRKEQDEFAFNSQQKAIAAIDAGKFIDEIVPIKVKVRREEVEFSIDEYPNRQTTLEKMATLRPAFLKENGTVTAGNAAGINDGASFTLIASNEALEKYNLEPLFEIIAVGQGGVDPQIMGMGPVPAISQALKAADLKLQDMELIELNEAFAAQSLGVIKELVAEHGINKEDLLAITNVNGGAIALGHPVGASGNRIIVTLMHEMLKRGVTYGLASLCIGGGMGTAVILKKV